MNEEVRNKALGDDAIIRCRPADLLEPEMDKMRAESGAYAKTDEDVLSYAMFPQLAHDFLKQKYAQQAGEAVHEIEVYWDRS